MKGRIKGVTPYQQEVLENVSRAAPDAPLDLDQLLETLSWAPTKESAQFTIRALVQKNLLTKSPKLELRRGRKRVCYVLTHEGKRVLDPRAPLPEAEIESRSGASAAGVEVEEVSDFEVMHSSEMESIEQIEVVL